MRLLAVADVVVGADLIAADTLALAG